MCEALKELFRPELDEAIAKTTAMVTEQVTQQVTEQVTEQVTQQATENAITNLIMSIQEICGNKKRAIEQLVKRYNLTEAVAMQKVEAYWQ